MQLEVIMTKLNFTTPTHGKLGPSLALERGALADTMYAFFV